MKRQDILFFKYLLAVSMFVGISKPSFSQGKDSTAHSLLENILQETKTKEQNFTAPSAGNHASTEGNVPATTTNEFHIQIRREKIDENLLTGSIYLNDEYIGRTYENHDLSISPGSYQGILRYHSQKGYCQDYQGKMGHEGDFLINVTNVPHRPNILLHGGTKPEQSEGCIMLGGKVHTDKIDDDHPLRKLRLRFYGTDTPLECPNKTISIEIVPLLEGTDSMKGSLSSCISVHEVNSVESCNTRDSYQVVIRNNCGREILVNCQYEVESDYSFWQSQEKHIKPKEVSPVGFICQGTGRFAIQSVESGKTPHWLKPGDEGFVQFITQGAK